MAAVAFRNRVGELAANDLILTGRVISALEAREMGLVSRVIRPEELGAETRQLLECLRGLSGPVLRVTRRALRRSSHERMLAELDEVEAIYLDELMKLDDATEGLQSFLEKRQPVWSDASK